MIQVDRTCLPAITRRSIWLRDFWFDESHDEDSSSSSIVTWSFSFNQHDLRIYIYIYVAALIRTSKRLIVLFFRRDVWAICWKMQIVVRPYFTLVNIKTRQMQITPQIQNQNYSHCNSTHSNFWFYSIKFQIFFKLRCHYWVWKLLLDLTVSGRLGSVRKNNQTCECQSASVPLAIAGDAKQHVVLTTKTTTTIVRSSKCTNIKSIVHATSYRSIDRT